MMMMDSRVDNLLNFFLHYFLGGAGGGAER